MGKVCKVTKSVKATDEVYRCNILFVSWSDGTFAVLMIEIEVEMSPRNTPQ